MAYSDEKKTENSELSESQFVLNNEEEVEEETAHIESDFNNSEIGFVIDDTYEETEEPAAETVEDNPFVKDDDYGKNDTEENVNTVDTVDVTDFSTKKKDKKSIKGFFTKGRIIAISIIAAVLLILVAVFFTLSHFWRNGEMKMPGFLASTGLYQGDSFRYFDGITVNGVDIGGLTKEQAAKKIEAQMKVSSVDYEITVKYEDKSIVLKKKDFEYSAINGSALKDAKEYCIRVMKGEAKKEKRNYTCAVTLSSKCQKDLAEKVGKVIHKDPVNATIEKADAQGLVFLDEQKGYDLDKDDFFKQIGNVIAKQKEKSTITAKVKFKEPTIKKAELTENIQELSSHSTTSTNNANGTANMTKAMNMCNGTVIEPGEVWSFNATTGNSEDQSAGWLPAAAYSGGYVVQSVGGGICQASTTIYVAALYANLGVVERSAHAWQSSYASPGFDATVDYRSLDLKLKNTSKYPVYLSCGASGRVMTCKIYGSKKDFFDKVEVFTETTARVPGEYFTVRTYRRVTLNGN
ncbi:MAG: VanW family protein [Clostridia bacterium]|nr:VanW family protein [Clostridia bacterium]